MPSIPISGTGFSLQPTDAPIALRAATALALAKKADVTQVKSAEDRAAAPKDPAKPAREFEALLIGQMLRSAHEAEDQEDPTGDTMLDMAAQQFSKVLADNGGLGLARIITQSFTSPNATNEVAINRQADMTDATAASPVPTR
jgi:Rod binding domain-containing protein